MGREVRRVPKDWQHPRAEHGSYRPLRDANLAKRLAEWDEGAAQWAKGLKLDYVTKAWVSHGESYAFKEWDGRRPDPANYMPQWPEAERTHLQMYENTSEGTPISPVMETPEQLARWLADNRASAFAQQTANYEEWLAMIRAGSSIASAVLGPDGLISGVAAVSKGGKP